jgi:type IV secretion/conjugal transfer VirB4 family ATPase
VPFIEHRRHAVGLADLLLYDSLIEDGVLLLHDGALLAAWKFRGPDLGSATNAEMATLSARLGAILKLGSGWMVNCDSIRSQAPGYPEGQQFPDSITRLIDDERKEQFMAEGAHFESEYFLSLTYLPVVAREERVKGWMFEGMKRQQGIAARVLEHFKARVTGFEDVFRSLFTVTRLKSLAEKDAAGNSVVYDELLRYVHRCVTWNDHRVRRPDFPVYLSDLLATEDFVGGLTPRIGKKHLRVIAIDGFPRASVPGILAALDTLPITYRWNTRAILLDAEEARSLLDKVRKKWRSKIRGLRDQIMQTQNGAVNLHAQQMSLDAEEAMSVAVAGDVLFAQYTSNVICADADEAKVDEAVGLVVKTIQNLGFAARVEDVNSVEAWIGSLPGDGYRNVRRVILHTLNLADLLPISAVWAGHKESPCPFYPPKSPPLLFAATTGFTPFRFNLHCGDTGHTLMVGPPGSGKSTFLGFIVAQFFRYPQAQVFAFDKGYSLQVLTRACGGEFYDLGGEKISLSFYPLADLAHDSDVAWASVWVEKLCALSGLRISPGQKNAIADAMNLLRSAQSRTMTDFVATVQDKDVRAALEPFTLGGPLGRLLDADKDGLRDSRLMVFEMENLMKYGDGSGNATVAVLLYLFRRIQKRLDGRPTLIVLDEAWVYLRDELFREYLRDWLKTLRKLNAVVVLATQNLSDVFNSGISDVVIEACPTKVLLANAEAASAQSRRLYEAMGLNEREIQIVQSATPKRQYYVISPEGRRLIALGLGEVALSFVGVNAPGERKKVESLIRDFPRTWQGEWLRQRGRSDWADWWREIEGVNERRVIA